LLSAGSSTPAATLSRMAPLTRSSPVWRRKEGGQGQP
jgi:hypothetical protein